MVKGGDPTTDNYVIDGGSFDEPIGLDEEQNAVVNGFGTLKARKEGGGFEGCVAHSLRADGFDASEDGTGRGTPIVAFSAKDRNGRGAPDSIVPPLKAQSGETGKGDAAPLTMTGMAVRRLTPRECERLQGFPDDWTLVDYRGKPAADGPRYKALGNAVTVNVAFWIASRIREALTGEP